MDQVPFGLLPQKEGSAKQEYNGKKSILKERAERSPEG